jgi:hypothetical protein
MLFKHKKFYEESGEEPPVCSCSEWSILVEQTDLDDSDDGFVYFQYAACDGSIITRLHSEANTYIRCVKADTVPILYIYLGGQLTTSIDSVATNTNVCC